MMDRSHHFFEFNLIKALALTFEYFLQALRCNEAISILEMVERMN
jgi:hypothetical protein